ncbi:MAG: MFS transporter [Mycobacterium sp.]|nr:MFS transporter [Mycobacterium sp.]
MKRRGAGRELFADAGFRELWGANLILTLGMVMLQLGCGWTMTSLTGNAVLVTMVQTMVSLPFFFFSIPAGIANDTWGSRPLLLASQVWMLLLTGVLAAIAWYWDLTPWWILSILFLIGAGLAVQQGAWKPFLHDMAPDDKLVTVISLNSLSNRLAQTAGPVMGSYFLGLAGIGTVFAARAASHLVMIVALLRLPRPSMTPSAGGRTATKLCDGWAVMRTSPQLYGPMIRCAFLMVPCSAVLALLPLEAKDNIQTDLLGYGGLLTLLGIGAASGVSLMPALRRRVRLNTLSTIAAGVFALSVLGISRWDSMFLDGGFLLFLGFCWSVLSISHQYAVQVAAPKEMRGLMNSLYSLVLQGSMAAGSFVFGMIAQHAVVSASVLTAGVLACCGLLFVRRYPIPDEVSVGSAG